MQTNIIVTGDSMCIRFEGRLDSSNASEFEKSMNEKLDGVRDLTFDFGDLQYISSAGLRTVLSCKKKMNAVQGTMTILNPNELVMDVFEATGFADILDIRQEA